MNNYGFTNARPGIDMSEVASVKDMIFNKAREKSASLASEREESMTQSVQNDVMQDARSSVMNNRMKPFGNLTKNTNSFETELKQPEPVQENIPDKIPQLKHNVQSVDNSVYTASMRDEAMNEARKQYSRKPTLMETLNFLNTQAAIRMVNKTHSKIV